MMNCLICSNKIDDKKDFTVKGPQGQDLDDTVGRLRHFDELGKWIHVTLTAQHAYTQVLLSGHVCPSHRVVPGGIALTDAEISIPVPSPAPAPVSSSPAAPKSPSPAALPAAAPPQSPASPTVRRKEPQS
jgi:hypothetical protein